MDMPASPLPSDTFLSEFGTPTLLWRVLHSVRYTEPPQYSWWEVDMTGDLQWFAVQGVVPPHGGRPAWTGWTYNSDGQTPWEVAQPPFPMLTQQWLSGSKLKGVRWSEVKESELRAPVLLWALWWLCSSYSVSERTPMCRWWGLFARLRRCNRRLKSVLASFASKLDS